MDSLDQQTAQGQPYNEVIDAPNKLRRINAAENEYWLAREISGVLSYANWENFNFVIEKAIVACKRNIEL